MKKQNLSSLVLKKNKISNLYNLHKFLGGNETLGCYDENPDETLEEYCTMQCNPTISINPLDCATNDKTRTLRPSYGETCGGLNTGSDC